MIETNYLSRIKKAQNYKFGTPDLNQYNFDKPKVFAQIERCMSNKLNCAQMVLVGSTILNNKNEN